MRVNCVVKPGWILERLARELMEIPEVQVNAGRDARAVDPGADIHYYLPAKDWKKYPCGGRAVGLFTHGNNGFDVLGRFDACVAMNINMAETLRERRARSVEIIRPGSWQPRRKPIFGVIGRVYNDGRKGQQLVAAALKENFDFVACGFRRPHTRAMSRVQWPCEVTHDIDHREQFYEHIDYLVVTSTEEGGPMTVPEAISRHVPVIAPDVGWSWEFPVIRYQRGSWESLRSVLLGLSRPPRWEQWISAHRRLFENLAERAA